MPFTKKLLSNHNHVQYRTHELIRQLLPKQRFSVLTFKSGYTAAASRCSDIVQTRA